MKTEILTLLRETDGYVSGQELCEKFGVSRTAVWKAINQLKEAGYEIEAVQNKGYRILLTPEQNSLQKRERRMEPMSLPKDRMQEKDVVAEDLTPRQGRESG